MTSTPSVAATGNPVQRKNTIVARPDCGEPSAKVQGLFADDVGRKAQLPQRPHRGSRRGIGRMRLEGGKRRRIGEFPVTTTSIASQSGSTLMFSVTSKRVANGIVPRILSPSRTRAISAFVLALKKTM